MAPINKPQGIAGTARWAGYVLTTGDRYLLLPRPLAERVWRASRPVYWRFMARQLRRIGIITTSFDAWRFFASQ